MGLNVSMVGKICTGHDCFPPSSITSGESTVLVNGIPAAHLGSAVLLHCCGPSCHGRSVSGGSGSVTVGGKPISRKTDSISCGGAIVGCSSNVFAG